jgi:hypothetical protein
VLRLVEMTLPGPNPPCSPEAYIYIVSGGGIRSSSPDNVNLLLSEVRNGNGF